MVPAGTILWSTVWQDSKCQGPGIIGDLPNSGMVAVLCCADQEWEDTGSTWGSSAARASQVKEAPDTPSHSRSPCAGPINSQVHIVVGLALSREVKDYLKAGACRMPASAASSSPPGLQHVGHWDFILGSHQS